MGLIITAQEKRIKKKHLKKKFLFNIKKVTLNNASVAEKKSGVALKLKIKIIGFRSISNINR